MPIDYESKYRRMKRQHDNTETKLRELVKEWRKEADTVACKNGFYTCEATFYDCADQLEQLLEKNDEQDK